MINKKGVSRERKLGFQIDIFAISNNFESFSIITTSLCAK